MTPDGRKKTMHMDKQILPKILLSLITLLLFACNSDPAIKTFANIGLAPSNYAKLEAPTGILILEIDGKKLKYAPAYHVLPGKHQLHVMVSAFKNDTAYKVGNIDISFTAIAEHVYQIKSLATSAQMNQGYNKKLSDFLWIEDKTLDSVVAGKKP